MWLEVRISQEPKRITSVIVIIKPDLLLKKLSYSRIKEKNKTKTKQTKKPIRLSSPNVHTLSQQMTLEEMSRSWEVNTMKLMIGTPIYTIKTRTSSLSPLSAVSSNYEG